MKNVLVTGGTGTLGREVVNHLLRLRYETSVLTSRQNVSMPQDYRIFKGDLEKDTGLDIALKNADVIIHCASNPKNSLKVDVEGTRNLLKAINRNKTHHLIYISIVGVDKSDYPYYKVKVTVEKMIKECGMPFTILRATQFHSLVLNIITSLQIANGGIIAPEGMRFQSIDVKEVASCLVELVKEKPAGLLPDRGGPEVLRIDEMISDYLNVFRLNYTLQLQKIKNERNDMFSSGVNLCPSNKYGKITWKQFLQSSLPSLH